METNSDEIYKENEKYLNDFAKWLENQGLSSRTINTHVNNVDFYLNDYLFYYEPQSAKSAYTEISNFLGDWFIRKATWSSCSHIKANATSIKKFYLFMLEQNEISQSDYQHLCLLIKDFMPTWLETMKKYDAINYDF